MVAVCCFALQEVATKLQNVLSLSNKRAIKSGGTRGMAPTWDSSTMRWLVFPTAVVVGVVVPCCACVEVVLLNIMVLMLRWLLVVMVVVVVVLVVIVVAVVVVVLVVVVDIVLADDAISARCDRTKMRPKWSYLQ